MKLKIFTIFFLILNALLHAQDPTYEWTKIAGSTSLATYDFGLSVDHDSFGNIYTVGYFQGTVDFDPGSSIYNLSSQGSRDMFIQKLDESGNFVWAVSFGSTDYSDIASDIVVDANDNVIITGFFRGTVDFDPSSTVNEVISMNYYKNFVLKLDANGNLLWVKAFGQNSFSDDYSSVDVDNNGSIYTTGYFRNTADFDPSTTTFNVTSSGLSDIFIHKLDAAGNFSWVRTMGSSNNHDIGHSIVVSDTGYIYTTGEFLGTVDFNSSSGTYNRSSNGIRDYYVHKLDINGNFIWARTAGGSANEIGRGIALDSNENIYFVGYMEDTADFDPSSAIYNVQINGYFNAFVAKFDSSGNFQWANNIGGTNVASNAYDISIDSEDRLYIVGYFENTADFDFSTANYPLTANGESDFFVQKIDSDSNFIWANAIGGSSWDVAYGVKIGPLNEIYTTGTFINTVDFDFSSNSDIQTLSGSSYQIFTSKWKENEALNVRTHKNTKSILFPNPAKGKVILRFKNLEDNIYVNITSVSGELILKKVFLNTTEIELGLKNFSKGIYFLNIKSDNIRETHKLIIN